MDSVYPEKLHNSLTTLVTCASSHVPFCFVSTRGESFTNSASSRTVVTNTDWLIDWLIDWFMFYPLRAIGNWHCVSVLVNGYRLRDVPNSYYWEKDFPSVDDLLILRQWTKQRKNTKIHAETYCTICQEWLDRTNFGQAGPVLDAKIGPAGPIFAPDQNFRYISLAGPKNAAWFGPRTIFG